MLKTNSFIEVNGNRYDALSGQILEAGGRVAQTTRASKKRVIDGFTMGAHHTRTRLVAKNVSSATPKNPAQDLHGRPQKAKTLVRGVVAKPNAKNSSPSSTLKHHVNKINSVRDLRAKSVEQHKLVKRFGNFGNRPTQMDITKTKPHKVHAVEAHVMTPPKLPSMVTSISHRKIELMLDEALMRADAHKQMLNERRHGGVSAKIKRVPKWLSVGLLTVALAAAAFFIILRNLPAVAVHVAASKAGVNATMPAYTPVGFSYSTMQYTPGAITMQFNAKAEPQQKFVITQQTSNENSASLAANTLPKDANVETSEVNGTTVYIYGDHNDATWVNNNVRYSLKNQANLTSDQVLKIAKSL